VTTIAAPICYVCRHKDPGEDLKCGAFPEGIPNEIALSKADHRLPFPGDRGIRFDPVDEDAAKYADAILGPLPARP
jgi:hypothetical protein